MTRTGGSTAADAAMPTRWRTAALDAYDGRRWTPTLTIRPIGRTLGPATGPTLGADVSFERDDLTLVPLPGSPVSVDADVETDPDRTIVRLAERPVPGEVVGIVSNVGPDSTTVAGGDVAVREVDENVAGLTGLAESLAESGDTVFGQLLAIEATMENNFVLDSDAPAGGLQRILIDRFLRDTRRGNTEQFVTAFVLLARSLGVDARVASGFVVEPPPDDASFGHLFGRRGDLAGGPADRRNLGCLRSGPRRGGSRDGTAGTRAGGADTRRTATPVAAPPEVDNESPEAETDTTDT